MRKGGPQIIGNGKKNHGSPQNHPALKSPPGAVVAMGDDIQPEKLDKRNNQTAGRLDDEIVGNPGRIDSFKYV